jgi:hypothetical protein
VKVHPFASLCLLGTPALFGEERVPDLHREPRAAAEALEADARASNP